MPGRFPLAALALLLVVLGLSLGLGCGNQVDVKVQPGPAAAVAGDQWQPAQPAQPAQQPAAGGAQPGVLPVDFKTDAPDLAAAAPKLTDQERFDAELLEALGQINDGKLTDALASLEAAKGIIDNDQVRQEIAKLKARIEQEAAAEQTVLNVSAVLNDGRADEASKLAADALAQFGSTPSAPAILKLKRQADALLTAQLDDAAARKTRFQQEAEAAIQAKNLRAAAVALEQALLAGADADLSRRLDDIRAALARYDESRQRAAELRRDPATLEDALAAYQDAARAWDTPEVRQDIDQCQLGLQKRRPRVAVADFEVRGDVGIPDAGREVAEELLPAFKVRFDVVERAQLGKVIDELKLQASDLYGDGAGRAEVAKLAKVRYLVLGSVSPVGGITVHARLVDANTGLVVQTAKIVAPDPDDVLKLVPQLANLLMMSDEERLAYEKQLADQAAKAAPPPPPPAVIPPPPEVVVDQPPPPPIVVFNARRPDVGGVRFEDFGRLPPPPPAGQALPQPVILAQPPAFQDKMLAVSVELGDNLFRRGRFREAMSHFELAVNLAPDRQDIRLRLDRCRPKLPPPAFVVNIAVGEPAPVPLPPPPRPRLAVLDLVEIGDPLVVPPGIGAWTAENLAPYFCPPYEVVDRGQVYWWMGRLGMSMRDLLTDPWAMRWLGRALNVRYFVVGCVRQTASFDVRTHLIDAEYGFEVGHGAIHCHDPFEEKLKLGALAWQTMLSPEDRLRWEQQEQEIANFLLQGGQCFDRGEFELALGFYQRALDRRPGNVEIQVFVQKCNQALFLARIEAERRRAWERQQAIAAEVQRRQWELAQASESARLSIQVNTGNVQVGVVLEKQRGVAYNQMFQQAQVAMNSKNFDLSIQLFESAVALRPSDDGYQQLALARARAQEAARARAAEQTAQREAALLQQRNLELAQTRAQLEKERQRRLDEEAARLKFQQQRDDAEYQRLVDAGERNLTDEKYAEAVVALQTARRLKKTDKVEALLTQALVGQARANAAKKGEAEKAALEKQLAEEKKARAAAEDEAARNRKLYEDTLKLAQAAFAQKKYDEAIVQYTAAKKVYQTDVVLTGLRQAEAAKAQDAARLEAEKKKADEEAKKQAELQRLLTAGKSALDAGKYDDAAKAYGDAKKLSPDNVDVLAGLSKAENLRDEAVAKAKRQKEEQERDKTFQTLLASGKANLAAKQYDAAVAALSEAVKLKPTDAAAKAALDDAEKALGNDAAAKAAAKKKAEDYQKLMGQARVALSAKQYDTARTALKEAQKLLPGDQASANLLKEVDKASGDDAAALAAEAKKKEEAAKKEAALKKAVADAKAALAVKDLAAAAKALDAAAGIAPKDADVVKLQADLAKAQDAAKAEADARKKRLEQYQNFIKMGQQAMTAKDYDQAAKVFADAARLVPEDKTAADLLKQAEKLRDEAKKNADATAKKKEEEERQRQVQQLLTQGRAAMAARKFDEAAHLFAEAEKIAPQDATVDKALKDLEQAKKDDAERAKKVAAYQDVMKGGRASLQAGRYAEAAKAAEDALKLLPGDKDATALLQSAQKGANDAADVEAKRKAQFSKLLTGAQQALAQKKYDDAIADAQDALKLVPGDKDATAVLQSAQKAQAEAKNADAEAKKKLEYNRLLNAGQTALAAKKFDDAAKSAQDALKLMPGDREATALLQAVQKAEAAEAAEAKKKADFNRLLTSGQQALNQKKYDEAVRDATDALKLMPGDKDATTLLKAAQKAQQDKKEEEEEQQRRAQFTQLLNRGQQLMAQKKYEDAIKAAQDALKLMPGDKDATALLQAAQKADAAADAEAAKKAEQQKLQAEYNKQMNLGQQLMAQKKYDAAAQAYGDALKAIPNDREATKGLQDAKKALDAAKNPPPPPPPPPPQKPDYGTLMKQGQTAMMAKKYDDAIDAFTQALKLKPGDKDATKALQDAQAAKKGKP